MGGPSTGVVVGVALIAAVAAITAQLVAAVAASLRQSASLKAERERLEDQLEAEQSRQREQLAAEGDRVQGELAHDRDLQETAELRTVLDDAVKAAGRARRTTKRMGQLWARGYEDADERVRVAALEQRQAVEQASYESHRLHLRFTGYAVREHPVTHTYRETLLALDGALAIVEAHAGREDVRPHIQELNEALRRFDEWFDAFLKRAGQAVPPPATSTPS